MYTRRYLVPWNSFTVNVAPAAACVLLMNLFLGGQAIEQAMLKKLAWG